MLRLLRAAQAAPADPGAFAHPCRRSGGSFATLGASSTIRRTAWRNEARSPKARPTYRPFVALAMCAVILTLQEYYGGRQYFYEATSSRPCSRGWT
jgi:hypothetical protein